MDLARVTTAAIVLAHAAGCGDPAAARYPRGARFELAAVSLDDDPHPIAGPGAVRLIEVGATWCEGCSWSADGLADVAARHPSAEVSVVFVDTDRAAIRRFAARHRIPGRILTCARRDCAAQFHGLSMPLFLVVDRRGNVVGSVSGYTLTTMVRLERMLHRAGLRHRDRPPSGGLATFRARSGPRPGTRGSRARRAGGPGSGWSGSGP